MRRTGRVRTPVRSAGYRFEIYKDKSGEYRFRFKASNGETMFGSEGYRAKASAMRAIQSIKLHTSAADVLDDS
ncbi:YegP family protein [Bauldia litoralis]|uniref:YegP family protein n=1 Tax=Bauldia litoralis TaxID=665467 RepID=UPI001FCDFE15|nr:DUF1508 domain-containing protein [Bauldia litoralis]